MMLKYYHVFKRCCLGALAIAVLFSNVMSFAYEDINEDNFFSYKRFFLNKNVISRMPEDGKIQKDLKAFAVQYTEGIYAISEGKLDKAEGLLGKAVDIWPEYFGSYFLLALIYEERGEYDIAARYYKTYLKKLNEFLEILGLNEEPVGIFHCRAIWLPGRSFFPWLYETPD